MIDVPIWLWSLRVLVLWVVRSLMSRTITTGPFGAVGVWMHTNESAFDVSENDGDHL